MVLQSSEQEQSPVVQNELEHKLKQKISTWGVVMLAKKKKEYLPVLA